MTQTNTCRLCSQPRSQHCELDEPGLDHDICDKMHHEFKPQTDTSIRRFIEGSNAAIELIYREIPNWSDRKEVVDAVFAIANTRDALTTLAKGYEDQIAELEQARIDELRRFEQHVAQQIREEDARIAEAAMFDGLPVDPHRRGFKSAQDKIASAIRARQEK